MLSATRIKEYEREIAITEKYRFGHLLLCYDNACVNKVDVRSIINKSFNTIYLNALNDEGSLMRVIMSLPNERIGIETIQLDKRYIKLYDIDNISEHKILGLRGNRIAQDEFDRVEAYYHFEELEDDLLVFESDERQGLGTEVAKYEEEYEVLKGVLREEVVL